MTIDDLSEKIDKRFDQVDDKLDMVNMTVAKHTVSLQGHDRDVNAAKNILLGGTSSSGREPVRPISERSVA